MCDRFEEEVYVCAPDGAFVDFYPVRAAKLRANQSGDPPCLGGKINLEFCGIQVLQVKPLRVEKERMKVKLKKQ